MGSPKNEGFYRVQASPKTLNPIKFNPRRGSDQDLTYRFGNHLHSTPENCRTSLFEKGVALPRGDKVPNYTVECRGFYGREP